MKYVYALVTVFAFIGIAVLCELADEQLITTMQWFFATLAAEVIFLLGLYKLKAYSFQSAGKELTKNETWEPKA